MIAAIDRFVESARLLWALENLAETREQYRLDTVGELDDAQLGALYSFHFGLFLLEKGAFESSKLLNDEALNRFQINRMYRQFGGKNNLVRWRELGVRQMTTKFRNYMLLNSIKDSRG